VESAEQEQTADQPNINSNAGDGRMKAKIWTAAAALAISANPASALTLLGSFNPSNAADLCSADYRSGTASVWVYGCSAANLQSYSTAGTFQGSITRPGESANDVDLDIAPIGLTLGSTAIPTGTLLFINGEAGTADIYAVDPATGVVVASLATAFGVSHVVGGAYHPSRGTFFLVQDLVPATADDNLIAEINPVTGAVLNTIETTAFSGYTVNFGDLDVHTGTGNLFIVSSDQTSILEITATGAFVAFHALPVGVSSLSGIGVDEALGEAWVSGTGGTVWRLGGLPAVSFDTDLDGLLDPLDNCRLVSNPTQLDADQDGYGNICDADLNNSGTVTTADFGLLRSVLGQSASLNALTAAADMNGSGTVTTADFGLLRARLGTAPGPSGLACAGTIPCP
jgi:hypothetical protein